MQIPCLYSCKSTLILLIMPIVQTLPCPGSGTGLSCWEIRDVLCRLMLLRGTERCQTSLVSSFAASGLLQTAGGPLQ